MTVKFSWSAVVPAIKMVNLGDKCSGASRQTSNGALEAYQIKNIISGEASPEYIQATDKPKTYAREAVGKT
jgi:hypothetical protein